MTFELNTSGFDDLLTFEIDTLIFPDIMAKMANVTVTDNCQYQADILRTLNVSRDYNGSECRTEKPPFISAAQVFYTYVTPIVLAVGLFGNILSLIVFLSKNMRKLSASTYLAALSISDICALLFYVLADWLRRGLPYIPGQPEAAFLVDHGFCQIQTYLSYVSRFVSAWIIVTFTVERYIGVCHPLKRKDICGSRSSQKVIFSLIIIAFFILIYKPVLTGRYEYTIQYRTKGICGSDRSMALFSFILDSIFALLITFIPFLLISILNALIIRRLYIRNQRHKIRNIVTEESIIRMEFTVILLVISFVFVTLNLPYFCFWCKRFFQYSYNSAVFEERADSFDQSGAELLITRVIFYLNYCVNFFLYSITGAYFRKELKMLFWYRKYAKYNGCSRLSNHSNQSTPQSWV